MTEKGKVIVNEGTVRSWVKKALKEHGTVPASKQAPVVPKRTEPVDSGDVPVLHLPQYRGQAEKRPSPRSTKSTRFEKGIKPEDLARISQNLKAETVEIGSATWTQDDLRIPEHRGLSVSGVRKELETASDKLQLMQTAPELVIQMLERAVKDYKAILKEPLRVVQAGLREYSRDLESTGELSKEDVTVLRSASGQAALAASRGFRQFFDDWIRESAPGVYKKTFQRFDSLWVESVFTLARTGTLDLDDATLASRSLSEDFVVDTKYRVVPTKVDRALILRDPGFRYYVSGLGGKHVYFWDWVRNAAQKVGRYTGQF